MKAKNRDIHRLNKAIETALKDGWTFIQTVEEFKRQGVSLIEHGVYEGTDVYYTWNDKSELTRKRTGKQPEVTETPDPAQIKKIGATLDKKGFDFDKFMKDLAKAGVCCFDVDIKNDEIRFHNGVTWDDKKGKHGKPIVTQKLNLKDGNALEHRNKEKLYKTFMQAGAEDWENAQTYAAVAKVGVASYIYFLDTAQDRITWNDGTTWTVESDYGMKPIKLSPAKFDPSGIPALVKSWDNSETPMVPFLEKLAKAGVQSYVTDLVNKKLIFYAQDGKTTKEVPIKF